MVSDSNVRVQRPSLPVEGRRFAASVAVAPIVSTAEKCSGTPRAATTGTDLDKPQDTARMKPLARPAPEPPAAARRVQKATTFANIGWDAAGDVSANAVVS